MMLTESMVFFPDVICISLFVLNKQKIVGNYLTYSARRVF